MSTSLYLMIQPENSEGAICECSWVEPYPLNPEMCEVHSGVIRFLQLVGVDPETDKGTVGDLIDQNYDPLEQVSYLADLVCQATRMLLNNADHPSSSNLGVRCCVSLLTRAMTLLAEVMVDEDTGSLQRKWRVCLRWN